MLKRGHYLVGEVLKHVQERRHTQTGLHVSLQVPSTPLPRLHRQLNCTLKVERVRQYFLYDVGSY